MADRELIQAVEAYFTDLRLVRGSGGATDERSLYVPLANLLNALGATMKPRVFCVQELADQGADHPKPIETAIPRIWRPTIAATPRSRTPFATPHQVRGRFSSTA